MGMIIRLVKSAEFDEPSSSIGDKYPPLALLENYEEKLHLVADFYKRQEHYDELERNSKELSWGNTAYFNRFQNYKR